MKTKIVATLGPASSSEEMLEALYKAGVDVFRLNFSHGDYSFFEMMIQRVRALNHKHRSHVAILADLQGPKIRIGNVVNDGVNLETGQEIILTTNECTSDSSRVFVNYSFLAAEVKKNEKILIDDGKIVLQVLSSNGSDEIKCRIVHGGILKPRKGVNLPDTSISLPSVTPKDERDLEFIMSQKVQWIALSFVRNANDILHLRDLIKKYPRASKVRIMAKIEKPEALREIDRIIEYSDAIMVARGDLGVELPLEEVPLIQKEIVRKCLVRARPVIIATQMMESMITNISPTRAEVNDVANSVLDGADALMLSGETSVGENPLEVIRNMARIIAYTEEHQQDIYYKHNEPVDMKNDRYLSDSVIYSACTLAKQTGARAIVTMTHSGYSAFRLSAWRPRSGIYVFTNNHSLLSILSLVWGVRGFYYDKFINTDHTIEDIREKLVQQKDLRPGEMMINIASTPLAELGKANMVKLSRV